MSRSLPYRLECPEKCLQAQDEALNSTFFIVRQTGPTAFVLKEDDERTVKVKTKKTIRNRLKSLLLCHFRFFTGFFGRSTSMFLFGIST